jgi:conjugal transfer mating pair stabilization protein TraN
LKTKKSSCCFNSKIARIIIEQGRSQLGMGWGSAQSPDCRGFTPDEMSRLKFDKMDLSEIASDIANSVVVPDSATLQNRVKESMKKYETK